MRFRPRAIGVRGATFGGVTALVTAGTRRRAAEKKAEGSERSTRLLSVLLLGRLGAGHEAHTGLM